MGNVHVHVASCCGDFLSLTKPYNERNTYVALLGPPMWPVSTSSFSCQHPVRLCVCCCTRWIKTTTNSLSPKGPTCMTPEAKLNEGGISNHAHTPPDTLPRPPLPLMSAISVQTQSSTGWSQFQTAAASMCRYSNSTGAHKCNMAMWCWFGVGDWLRNIFYCKSTSETLWTCGLRNWTQTSQPTVRTDSEEL